MKKLNLKATFKTVGSSLKKLSFWLGFLIAWILLESPFVFGMLMWILTTNGKWLAIATGWLTLTAPPLPIPVIPLSIASGSATVAITNKIKKKKEAKKND